MSRFNKATILGLVAIGMLFAYDITISLSWYVYIIPVLLFLLYVVLGSSIMSLNVFAQAYTHPKTSQKEIALTFDDGPDESTNSILDVLKGHEIKATFFCVGKKIKAFPEIVKRMHQEGHVVGNHSYWHGPSFPFSNKKSVVEEIRLTDDLIREATGITHHIFRPPFGVMNPAIARATRTTKQKIIGWNIRSFDTKKGSIEKVTKRVLARIAPGSVILLHDDREDTVKILERILQYAQSQNYVFVDVLQLFNIDRNEN